MYLLPTHTKIAFLPIISVPEENTFTTLQPELLLYSPVRINCTENMSDSRSNSNQRMAGP
jgi:hypothetical protein